MSENNFINVIDFIKTKDDIMDEVEKLREKGDVRVNVLKEQYKIKTKNEFVILFYETLEILIKEYKLTLNDVRIILCLLKRMEYGNLIKYSQKSIAAELEMSTPNLNRNFKRLKKLKIILEVDGNEYIDPQILCKGNLAKQSKRENNKSLKEQSLFNSF